MVSQTPQEITAGCGLVALSGPGSSFEIYTQDHPFNFGKLRSKDPSHLLDIETLVMWPQNQPAINKMGNLVISPPAVPTGDLCPPQRK